MCTQSVLLNEINVAERLVQTALLHNPNIDSLESFFSLLGSIVLTGVLLGRQLARDAQQARVRDPRWDTAGFRKWANKGQVAFLKVRCRAFVAMR